MSGDLLVFGRTEYADPLTDEGEATATDDVLSGRPGPWVELIAFPRDAVHWIIRDGEEADGERTVRSG